MKILLNLIYIINIGTIFFMIFKEKRPATSIVSWSLMLGLAPVFGLVAFVFVGRKVNQAKMFRIDESDLAIYEYYHAKMIEERRQKQQLDQHPCYDMISCLENMSYAPYRNHNRVTLYSEGDVMFEKLKADLRAAQSSIHIQFYIFKPDELGTEILEILEQKARDGIEVRLLYDSVGSRLLKKKKLAPLVAAGGQIGEFFPAHFKLINFNMNHRNHRKIVVVDEQIAFIGGFNIGDEYIGKDKKFGYWRDTHIRYTGEAVKDLNLRFLADWQYAADEDVDWDELVVQNEQRDKATAEQGEEGIQILASGPNDINHYEIKLTYLTMIKRAKSYLYIQTPYLILDTSIKDSLALAALSGVDVRIMIPGKGDHPFVYWANLSYVGELLKSGVRVYHYEKESFLHAKTVVVDDEVTSVGTANMDIRSFELNFEVNAVVYSQSLAKEQRRVFEQDVKRSVEMTLDVYEQRGRVVEMKEGISRLFSSLL